MFAPLPTPEEMAAWDAWTIQDLGIKAEVLMENAAREALTVLRHRAGPLAGKSALVFCGGGNNGGDGFAVARLLAGEGAAVAVLHTKAKNAYRGETRHNMDLCRRLGIPLKHLSGGGMDRSRVDLVVDALMGTGFEGELREDMLGAVRQVNALGRSAFVLSIDVPSGLSGRTGRPQPEAVEADATVAFHAAKLGLVQPEAEPFVGELFVQDIGIPPQAMAARPAGQQLMTDGLFTLLAGQDPAMHKGGAGHVLVVGGARGMTGAPVLAARAALRAGAGLVTIACPGANLPLVAPALPDAMTLTLGEGTEFTADCLPPLVDDLARFDAVVLGPGLGRGLPAAEFHAGLADACRLPAVHDADALFHLAGRPSLWQGLPDNAVFTPHPGEMARLLDATAAHVQEDRLAAARAFAGEVSGVVVLKGAATVVAQGSEAFVSPIAEPALAVGGSGDVLSGVVGALLARGMGPLRSTCLGVYWHGSTGRLLAAEHPARGVLPTDIADALPRTAKEHAC